MDKRQILRVVRVLSIVVVIAAIVVQARTLADAGRFDATRFLAFFTIQSNLVGVAAFAWVLSNGDRPRSRNLELFRGASAGYLTVTFLVVVFLLSGVDVQLQLVWVDIVLHKIFPIIVVLDWILDPPQTRLAIRDAAIWLVYPIAWTVLTVIRGAIDGWYPYPFLDPSNGGYGKVAVTVVAVTIGFVVIAAAYVALGNWRRDANAETRAA